MTYFCIFVLFPFVRIGFSFKFIVFCSSFDLFFFPFFFFFFSLKPLFSFILKDLSSHPASSTYTVSASVIKLALLIIYDCHRDFEFILRSACSPPCSPTCAIRLVRFVPLFFGSIWHTYDLFSNLSSWICFSVEVGLVPGCSLAQICLTDFSLVQST